jgi:hypothetical protein
MSDTTTTTELLSAIKALDLTVRELTEALKQLASRPAPSFPAAGGYTPPKASPTVSRSNEEIPQPSEIVANAGEVEIHFGKNAGVPLSSLGERSLSWYASEQPPRLNSQGVPFPMRPQEITLRNAARTLWHQNKGTLKGGENVPTPSAPAANTAHGNIDEDVPF